MLNRAGKAQNYCCYHSSYHKQQDAVEEVAHGQPSVALGQVAHRMLQDLLCALLTHAHGATIHMAPLHALLQDGSWQQPACELR